MGKNDRHPFLVGERLCLRPFTEVDITESYISWFNDPDVSKFNSHFTFPYTFDKAVQYMSHIKNNDNSFVLAMIHRKTEEHIGNIALDAIDFISRNADLTIIVGNKKYWHEGYGKEASKLVCTHGFLQLNLHRISCGTHVANSAMRNLALYLGMREEGRRREALYGSGQYHDIIEFGVLRNEFIELFGCN